MADQKTFVSESKERARLAFEEMRASKEVEHKGRSASEIRKGLYGKE